jgi:hypothetical protein
MGQEMLEQFRPSETKLREKIGTGINDIRDSLRVIARKGLDSGLVERVREGAYGVLGEVREALERFSPKRVQAILTEGLSQEGKVPGKLAGGAAEVVVDLVSPQKEGQPIKGEEERQLTSIFEKIGGKRFGTAVVNLVTSERGEVSRGEEEKSLREKKPPSREETPLVYKEYRRVPLWERPMTRRTFFAVGTVVGVTAVGAGVKPVREFFIGIIRGLFVEAPRATGEKIREEEIKKKPGGEGELKALSREDKYTKEYGEGKAKDALGLYKDNMEYDQAMFEGTKRYPPNEFLAVVKDNWGQPAGNTEIDALIDTLDVNKWLVEEAVAQLKTTGKYTPEELDAWRQVLEAVTKDDENKDRREIKKLIDEGVAPFSSTSEAP